MSFTFNLYAIKFGAKAMPRPNVFLETGTLYSPHGTAVSSHIPDTFHRCRSPKVLIPSPGPEILRIRRMLDSGEEREIRQYYMDWDTQRLSKKEYDALYHNWRGKDFSKIHCFYRNPKALPTDERARIRGLSRLMRSGLKKAPSIPLEIKEIFRGESHETITLEQAKQWVKEGKIRNEKSFFPVSVSEGEAFNFARDYHHAVPIGNGLSIPLAVNAAPESQQIVYRILIPDNQREKLKAGYLGGTIREMLFPPGLKFRYTDAHEVLYLPAYDVEIQSTEVNGKVVPSYTDYGGTPEKRLMLTLEPV